MFNIFPSPYACLLVKTLLSKGENDSPFVMFYIIRKNGLKQAQVLVRLTIDGALSNHKLSSELNQFCVADYFKALLFVGIVVYGRGCCFYLV